MLARRRRTLSRGEMLEISRILGKEQLNPRDIVRLRTLSTAGTLTDRDRDAIRAFADTTHDPFRWAFVQAVRYRHGEISLSTLCRYCEDRAVDVLVKASHLSAFCLD